MFSSSPLVFWPKCRRESITSRKTSRSTTYAKCWAARLLTVDITVADPQITVIIPNWNGRAFLPACLSSLTRQSVGDFAVLLVDNGSEDNSVTFVREHFPFVRCLTLPENRGFGAAVNAGIGACASPWLFLLNNDTEVEEHCLERLLAATKRYPEADFFALKMLNFHDHAILDGAGDAALRAGVGYRLGTMEQDRGQYDEDRPVFGACAGAALYSRRLFERIGLFDEDFFAYLEDVDLNFRACRAGLSCRYLAGAVVYHIGSASSGAKISPLTVRLSTRNCFFVGAKNYSLPCLPRLLPAMLIYQITWLILVIKKRQFIPWLQGLIKALSALPRMRRKFRRDAALPDDEFVHQLTEAEHQVVASIMARRRQEGKGNALLDLYQKIFL
ncbi:MAG TPA: glycosyltransferase family 2 protein [Desulfobulbaceae bacterium]|nr:glycosyltransferase family 2 protein [Desulfobulbaceae bacterium]